MGTVDPPLPLFTSPKLLVTLGNVRIWLVSGRNLHNISVTNLHNLGHFNLVATRDP